MPVSFALLNSPAFLGLGFAIFHALILLNDHYIGYTFVQVLVPFSSSDEPFWGYRTGRGLRDDDRDTQFLHALTHRAKDMAVTSLCQFPYLFDRAASGDYSKQ